MKRLAVGIVLVAGMVAACSRSQVEVRSPSAHQAASVEGYVSPGFHPGVAVGFSTEDQISAALAAELGKRGYRIIERARLDAVISEQALAQTGLTKDEQVAHAGQIANVRFLISVGGTPTLDKYGNPHPDKPVTASVKIVDTQSAEIVGAITYTNASRKSSGSKSDLRHKESGTEAAREIAEYIDRLAHQ